MKYVLNRIQLEYLKAVATVTELYPPMSRFVVLGDMDYNKARRNSRHPERVSDPQGASWAAGLCQGCRYPTRAEL